MTKRPLNRCRKCPNTWFPRGRDLSPKCGQCGSTAVEIVYEYVDEAPAPPPNSSPIVPLAVGCLLLAFVFGGAIAWFVFSGVRQVAKNDPGDKPGNGQRPKQEQIPSIKQEPPSPKDTELPPRSVPIVPIAPLPRAVPLNRPPEGFTTKWERRGGVQTRVIGAAVTFPVLTDDTHRAFPSKTAVLLVWVETQSLTATGISLRRWINPLNEYGRLTDSDSGRIKPAKFPTGARVAGELEGGHSLPPGGPSVVDLLAFEVPSVATRNVFLVLTASHVAETGEFVHAIPYEVWSKK